MGDLPLRTPNDRRLGGPLPRLLPNQSHPHPSPINLYSTKDVLSRDHQVLIHLSMGYPWAMGRLDTRYAPVRRSPSIEASFNHAAPRLACVKPVASVHPEPGSNSSLYIFFIYDCLLHYWIQHHIVFVFEACLNFPDRVACYSYLTRNDGSLVLVSCTTIFCLCKSFKNHFSAQDPYPPRGVRRSSFADAKVRQLFGSRKTT